MLSLKLYIEKFINTSVIVRLQNLYRVYILFLKYKFFFIFPEQCYNSTWLDIYQYRVAEKKTLNLMSTSAQAEIFTVADYTNVKSMNDSTHVFFWLYTEM